ncbi:uroporphyrinogen decarboxylase family protein [Verrucomicrobiota bacterium]
MNSKERIKTVLKHKQPDRIPVGERDYASNSFIKELLGRESLFGGMKSYQALWNGHWQAWIDSVTQDLPELIDRLQWDIVVVWPNIGKDTPVEKLELIDEKKGLYRDSAGNMLQYTEEGDRILIIEESGKSNRNRYLEELGEKETLPSEQIVRDALLRRYGKTHYIVGAYSPFSHPSLSYSSGVGLEKWVMQIYEDPDGWQRNAMNPEIEKWMELTCRQAKKIGIDAYAFGMDFGHSGGPFISPDRFEKLVYPKLKRDFGIAHKHGLDVFLHQCGDNRPLMDMIVDAGVDIIQSIQPEEHIEELKAKYGHRVTLMGGVTFKSLILGTPEDVKKETFRALDQCAHDGGFILASQHSLPHGLKPRNYLAMLEAKREWEKINLK